MLDTGFKGIAIFISTSIEYQVSSILPLVAQYLILIIFSFKFRLVRVIYSVLVFTRNGRNSIGLDVVKDKKRNKFPSAGT